MGVLLLFLDHMKKQESDVIHATARFLLTNGGHGSENVSSGTNYTFIMSTNDIDSFDILAWWKGREAEFPVLSAMARDLLSSQASTVASESAFSTCGRVISLRRTRLSTEAVEMCICLKDHLDAIDRKRHLTSLEDNIEPE
ncbi:hypothetical protein QVD17_00540 [Tagetes erecta]|uniref:HAT C-terminal dimerisation domain-containing protein n=1 Tax=Tagetes erecta TaxID=13708 RepID=A0AAD8LAD8_TARER|nr:hypothetical protein QVD17_00540 [Tagetes erecta]